MTETYRFRHCGHMHRMLDLLLMSNLMDLFLCLFQDLYKLCRHGRSQCGMEQLNLWLKLRQPAAIKMSFQFPHIPRNNKIKRSPSNPLCPIYCMIILIIALRWTLELCTDTFSFKCNKANTADNNIASLLS